jgi:hypothetical protein
MTSRLAAAALALMTAFPALAAPVKQGAKDPDAATCYTCHEPVKALHTSGKHAKVGCGNCHSGLAAHVGDPGPATRPATDFSWEACGKCHKAQYDSYMQVSLHRPARDEKSQLTNRSPDPFWDKLMAGHGFTKEHSLTRSHVNMLVDQFAVDRSFGGRFQGIRGWEYVLEKGKVWDILKDTRPGNSEQKAVMTQSAAAANPTCMKCKTQDNILNWAYKGDPIPGAKFSRTSNPVEVARSVNHGLNCFTCHDPHAARPPSSRRSRGQRPTRSGTRTRSAPASRSSTWGCAASRGRSRCSRSTTPASCAGSATSSTTATTATTRATPTRRGRRSATTAA